MAMTLLSTYTVPSTSTGLVTFSNIPQTGKDLLVLGAIRTNNGSNESYVEIQLNEYGDGARILTGSATSTSSSAAGYILAGFTSASGSTSNAFGSLSAYVSNYTFSGIKLVSSESVAANSGNSRVDFSAGQNNTNPVTSLTVRVESDFFVQNSVISLYVIS
jgi:hypothetical protein